MVHFQNKLSLSFSGILLFNLIACGGSGGDDPVVAPANATASISASQASITSGESTTINWSSTNATSCSGSNFDTAGQTSGSISLQPVNTTEYSTTCSGEGASSTASVTVTVNAANLPTVTLTASPTMIESGQISTLSWTTSNASSCLSNHFSTNNNVSGDVDVMPTETTSYLISCLGIDTNSNVSVDSSVTVTISETGATFYVANAPQGDNANNGSQDSPWEDIQFGVNQLNAGETLIVNAGTYNETVLFSGLSSSGTFGSPVQLLGLDGAIIDGTGLVPSGRLGLITIRNAEHIIIENLEIANYKTSTGVEIDDTPLGILIDGSSKEITIKNNNIHDIQNLSSCDQNSGCGPGANGLAVYGSTSSAITGLVIENNEISNCILSSSEALTLNGNIDGFKILNNYVHDNNNIGIDFIGYESDVCNSCTEKQNRARNGIVKGNRAINNSTNLALGGFSNNPWYGADDGSAGGFYVDGGRNIIFDSNLSSQNDLGFEFASEHSGKSSDEILMINNFVVLNREVGLTIGGYAESTSGEGGGNASNIYVYNNSFYKNKGWGTEIAFSYRVNNASFVNNILVGSGSVSDNFAQETNGQHQNISWNNNIWWADDVSDTSDLQGSSIIQDPLYINPDNGELSIQVNSPAIDIGQVQADLTSWEDTFWLSQFENGIILVHGEKDINGNDRINAQIDIGAVER